MNIFIATYGSRGDVQPYVALGVGLQKAGHQVTIATSERFQAFIIEHGLQYGYMNDDLLAILDTPQGRNLMENTRNLFQVIAQTFRMMKQVGPMQQSLLEDSWQAAQKAKPDLIIFHPKAYGGPLFAEKLGIPTILALLIPMLVPTSKYPNIGFPNLRLGGWYNRATYGFVNKILGWSAGKYIKSWRKANNLPPQNKFNILQTTAGENIPVIHGFSQHIIPSPSDWPSSSVTKGYWFLNPQDNWTPPPTLENFLNAGEPPIYIGFGSMAGRNPKRLADVVIDGLKKLKRRGIIATGWGGLETSDLPETILQIDQAPHEWLFPRVAAIVHHGGAGTTAASLRAGKPSLIVPFFGDQPFWGQKVYELGISPKPIPQKKLTAKRFTQAIEEIFSNPQMVESAAEIGKKIREEDGIGNAISFIEEVISLKKN